MVRLINILYKQYGVVGILKLMKNLMLTRILYRSARLIKFPIDIRHRQNISFGSGLSTGVGCRIEAYPFDHSKIVLKIGKNLKINDYVHITAHESVIIGDNVLLASNVYISDVLHGCYSECENSSPCDSLVAERQLFSKSVHIGNNVWIGEKVCVLPGVFIGDNCIIGAGSIVTKSFPENVIIAGNPAKVIKYYNNKTNRWCRS